MGSFRRFRKRYLPFFPEGSEIRQWRNKLLRKMGLTRAYEPALLSEQPDLRYGSLLPLVVAEHVLEHGELTFLQIGAFDGQEGDEIFNLIERFPVRGVLVEPQPMAFKSLEQLHANRENLLLVNAAISDTSGTRPFYTSIKGDVQVASFDRNHLLRHEITSDEIAVHEVSCLTVDEVLRLGGLATVDLLQIDAEGFDYEIIKSIDFDRICPRLLRFEFRHFSDADLEECLKMLAGCGYRFLVEKLDIIAVQHDEAADSDLNQTVDTAPSVLETAGPARKLSA